VLDAQTAKVSLLEEELCRIRLDISERDKADIDKQVTNQLIDNSLIRSEDKYEA